MIPTENGFYWWTPGRGRATVVQRCADDEWYRIGGLAPRTGVKMVETGVFGERLPDPSAPRYLPDSEGLWSMERADGTWEALSVWKGAGDELHSGYGLVADTQFIWGRKLVPGPG